MTDSLALEFTVAASPDHAFRTWTGRMAAWWPAAKTVSGAPESVQVEPRVGGRIVERDAAGAERRDNTLGAWRVLMERYGGAV